MGIYISVLFAIITARILEWVVVASAKYYQERKVLKFINRDKK